MVIIIKAASQATKKVLSTLGRLTESEGATDEIWDKLWTTDDHGDTVVHWAARLGCCRTLRRALTADVVSVPNHSGVTPLHVAADRGLRDEVEVGYSLLVTLLSHRSEDVLHRMGPPCGTVCRPGAYAGGVRTPPQLQV